MDDSAFKVMRARREFEDLVPAPWNREQFLANLSAKRGRPIRLTAVDTSALEQAPCGVWLSYALYDEIVYDSCTSRLMPLPRDHVN
ncbi:hypothetical protein ACFWAY_19265 [Rhodococcus sp. NPDC059968]|uniref:hypothetical protein n=1 Tax=Rhodococcus sp. NPDC059968 TaxID=3347017 RepID=UPI003670AD8D